jgi:hypothetical protein
LESYPQWSVCMVMDIIVSRRGSRIPTARAVERRAALIVLHVPNMWRTSSLPSLQKKHDWGRRGLRLVGLIPTLVMRRSLGNTFVIKRKKVSHCFDRGIVPANVRLVCRCTTLDRSRSVDLYGKNRRSLLGGEIGKLRESTSRFCQYP